MLCAETTGWADGADLLLHLATADAVTAALDRTTRAAAAVPVSAAAAMPLNAAGTTVANCEGITALHIAAQVCNGFVPSTVCPQLLALN